MANTIVIDVIAGPCPGPDGCPVEVTPNNGNICQDVGVVGIAGSCFDLIPSGNTVVFNLGAAGTVTSAAANFLTVTFTTGPTTTGPLTAVVANGNGNSGTPIQVATVIAACGPGCSFSRVPQPVYNSNGTAVNTGAAVGVTCGAGETLVVKVTAVNGDYANLVTVTWNGQTLTKDRDISGTGLGQSGRALIFSCATLAAATADVSVTVAGTIGAVLTIQPIRLVGSATNSADVGATKSGASSVANTGNTAGTAAACEIAEALILRLDGAQTPANWINDFIGGGHLRSSTLSYADEGWKLASASTTTVNAAISDSAIGWAAAVEVYR